MTKRLTAALAGAALLLAAACDAEGPRSGLGPPLPEGEPRVLTAADDGGAVEVAVGEILAVALIGVPTAGYVWEADSAPDFLVETDALSGPTSPAQLEPGFAGGNHWEVLVFEVAAPGAGRLALVQRRPWETDEPPADAFAVEVTAR